MTMDPKYLMDPDPDGGLRGYLSRLPAPDPTASLWPRIEHTRRWRRRRRRLLGTGTVLGTVALLTALMVREPTPFAVPAVTLEAAPVIEIQADLRDIDHRLQAAYDQNASPEQIDFLWQAREFAATEINQENYRHDALIRL